MWLLLLVALGAMSAAASDVTLYLRFGVGDPPGTRWDGHLRVSAARIVRLEGWREARAHANPYQGSFQFTTRDRDDGLLLTLALEAPDATLYVDTAQGSFAAEPAALPASFLDGRVTLTRVAPASWIGGPGPPVSSPALAAAGDAPWLADVETVRGDQVFARRYAGSWSDPEPVSDAGAAILGCAAAVDAEGALWVFWAERREGDFDIYARRRLRGAWDPAIRVTAHPGADVTPAAVTDATGRVWVVWQAFRGEGATILAVAQTPAGFSREAAVTLPPRQGWSPVLAAGPAGEVAFSWTSYATGTPAVLFRKARFDGTIVMESPLPVAAPAANPSPAFDARGRIWFAYETGDRWTLRCVDGFRYFAAPGYFRDAPGAAPWMVMDGGSFNVLARDASISKFFRFDGERWQDPLTIPFSWDGGVAALSGPGRIVAAMTAGGRLASTDLAFDAAEPAGQPLVRLASERFLEPAPAWTAHIAKIKDERILIGHDAFRVAIGAVRDDWEGVRAAIESVPVDWALYRGGSSWIERKWRQAIGLLLPPAAVPDRWRQTEAPYILVWTRSREPAAILAALREDRAYTATTPILAFFRRDPATPRLTIRLIGSAPFATLTILRDGSVARTWSDLPASVDLDWIDPSPGEAYRLHGVQADGHTVTSGLNGIQFAAEGYTWPDSVQTAALK